jgi:hypothetical protein
MTCNMGKTDKILRLFIGLGVIGAGYYFKSWWGAIGLIPLFTALVGFCPLYKLVGISTCKTKG